MKRIVLRDFAFAFVHGDVKETRTELFFLKQSEQVEITFAHGSKKILTKKKQTKESEIWVFSFIVLRLLLENLKFITIMIKERGQNVSIISSCKDIL